LTPLTVVAAVIALGALAVTSGLVDRARELIAPGEVEQPAAATDPGDPQPTVALLTYDEADPSGLATGLVVLAYDRETQEGTILLVPVATIADVPGYGSFQLAEAHAFGQGPLVAVTLDNLLGLRLDGLARLSEADWATLLSRVGGFEVDVRSPVVDRSGQAGETRFPAGVQFLDGPRLAEYLTARDDTETELESLPRVQQVLFGLLDRIALEPGLLDEAFADDASMIDTADPQQLRRLLAELATARARDEVTTLTLPVATLGSGRDDLYRIDTARLDQLVTERFSASRPAPGGAGADRSIQILNGNGVPGVGQQVAERLSAGGYRIVLTGNADRFDHPNTRIVIYGESPEELEIARDVQQRLGVGEIQRSGTPQSVVDVTIVVGADFPPPE
jgi:polyisoprenyl-teichoic acid--peptidoglycan teichoic acid transferase